MPVCAILEIVKDKYLNMAKTEIVLAYNIILKALPVIYYFGGIWIKRKNI